MKTDPSRQPSQDGWWREWFNTIYLDVYAHRDEGEADTSIQMALSKLPLPKQDWILDLCCGNGRHCRALRKAGFTNTIGIDYSMPLLEQALMEPPKATYLRSDMRLMPLQDESCSAVLSFFTSFGYFKRDVENLSVLHEIARVLRGGGWFLLDYLNPSYVRDQFEPETVKRHEDYTIHEIRSFSEDGERIEKEIRIENWGGEDHRYFESVRLYEHEEMIEMLHSTGLHIMETLGDFDSRPFTSHTPRMILLGAKQND